MSNSYLVDFGDRRKILKATTVKWIYDVSVDKNEYATFDCWMWDMKRNGLITEV